MKYIIMFLIGALIISCNLNKKEDQKQEIKPTSLKEKSENFDWLLGKWKRTNEEEGKETFENWKKINASEYSGIGFTMQNRDTLKQEKIRLIKKDGKWSLTVKTPEEKQTVTFKGVSYTKNEFICENNEIDFPNRIKYWINGTHLNATVSSEEMKIEFEFEKLNN